MSHASASQPSAAETSAIAPQGLPHLPLEGIRVLDLGRYIAAPWCTQLLGDLGADVIKVERPDAGDQMRQYGPPFLSDTGGNSTSESSYFVCANRNKRSVAIDISAPEGQELVLGLAAEVDILVENFRCGDLARFGLDYVSVRRVNDDMIYCSITGFGQTGPYARRPGLDSVFQAMSGLMSITGEADGPPQKVGVTIMDIVTGLYATTAILSALRHRERGGGQHIDMALMDAAVAVMSHRAQDYLLTGEIPHRSGTETMGSAPAQVFRCRDGEINIQAGDQKAFEALCGVLGLQKLVGDPKFGKRSDRWLNRAEFLPELQAAIAQWGQRELYTALVENDIVSAPIYTLDRTFSDPQVIDRGLIHTVQHPLSDELPLIRNPIRFSETPIDNYRPPPLLGQHTGEVLSGLLGLSLERIDELSRRNIIRKS